MRKEFQIALILAVAAVPLGLAVSSAFEYFPILKGHPGFAFWSSSGLTLALLLLAAFIAIRGEQSAEREGKRRRMIPLIGMIVFGAGFLGCAAWYLWPINAQNGPIEWAFEQPGAYGLNLEWSIETPGEMPTRYQVEGLIFKGKNVSDRPIYKMSAYVTVDDDKREIPLYMAAGQWRNFDDIESIPSGAKFTIGCQTREDGLHCLGFTSYLSPEQFMHEIGAFTLTCRYDDLEQKWHFSANDIQKHFDEEKKRAEERAKSQARTIVIKKSP